MRPPALVYFRRLNLSLCPVLILSSGYCLLWLLGLGYLAWRLGTRRGAAPPLPAPATWPAVSILLAARNEEAALPRCLASLQALRYPPHKLEILVGDDASTDRTRAVAEAALRNFAGRAAVLPIVGTLGLARGKANVLAQLARQATGEYFFITDADMALPPTWLPAMLAHAAPGVGTVTGLSVVAGTGWLARLQAADWLQALALLQTGSEAGQPMTAMGNNMLVSRAAYQAVGGYEALPFSVTEDYALFAAVNAHGFGYRQVFGPAVRAATLPAPSWAALVSQRLRWLRGVEALPGRVQAAALVFNGYWLAVAALLGSGHWPWVLAALALKIGLQGGFMHVAARRAGLPAPPAWVVLAFEPYALALALEVTLRRVVGPRRVRWKGREYRA